MKDLAFLYLILGLAIPLATLVRGLRLWRRPLRRGAVVRLSAAWAGREEAVAWANRLAGRFWFFEGLAMAGGSVYLTLIALPGRWGVLLLALVGQVLIALLTARGLEQTVDALLDARGGPPARRPGSGERLHAEGGDSWNLAPPEKDPWEM